MTFLPLAIVFGTMLFSVLILFAVRFYYKTKKRRTPFPDKLLRSPGQYILKQLDDLNEDILTTAFSIWLIPLILYSVHISQLYFGGKKDTLFHILLTSLVIIGFLIYGTVKF
jgi:hypothetical protein